MSFPVFSDIKATLQNWSIKLTQRLQFLEEQAGAYLVNTEILTNETWVGGQPIYRKVFTINSFPNATEDTYDLNIQYSSVVRVRGYATNGQFTLPLPWVFYTAINLTISAYVDKDKLKIGAGINRSAYSGYVIVEYTK